MTRCSLVPARVLLAALFTLLVGVATTLAQDLQPLGPEASGVWEASKEVATTATDGDFTPAPVLAVAPNGNMIIAYNNVSSGVQTPWFSASTDGGSSWSTPAPIHNAASDRRQVAVVYDNSNRAHAVWRDNAHVFHARRGQWPSAATTLPGNGERILDAPSIAVGPDNRLHVVWAQGDNLENIFHAFSTDAGASWTLSPALANTSEDSSVPQVAVDSAGTVHIVWEERIFDPTVATLFRFEIHYKKGTPSGSGYSWPSIATVLSTGITSAKRPAIVTEGTTVHLGFTRQVSNQEQYAYYRKFTPGSGWNSPSNVNPDQSLSVNTSNPYFLVSTVAPCDGNAFYYFHGAVADIAKEQVWGATSDDNWNSLDVVTSPDRRHINPSVGCRSDKVHLASERIDLQGFVHKVVYTSRSGNAVLLPAMFR